MSLEPVYCRVGSVAMRVFVVLLLDGPSWPLELAHG